MVDDDRRGLLEVRAQRVMPSILPADCRLSTIRRGPTVAEVTTPPAGAVPRAAPRSRCSPSSPSARRRNATALEELADVVYADAAGLAAALSGCAGAADVGLLLARPGRGLAGRGRPGVDPRQRGGRGLPALRRSSAPPRSWSPTRAASSTQPIAEFVLASRAGPRQAAAREQGAAARARVAAPRDRPDRGVARAGRRHRRHRARLRPAAPRARRYESPARGRTRRDDDPDFGRVVVTTSSPRTSATRTTSCWSRR